MSRPIVDALRGRRLLGRVLADLLGVDEAPGAGAAVRCVYPDRHEHGDANPSLVVSKNGAGAQCMVCGFGGGLLDIAMDRLGLPDRRSAAAELERRYLGGPSSESKPGQPTGPAEAVYDYEDEESKLLYQILRFPTVNADGARDKTFRARRPNPDRPGSFLWNLKSTRRVLFRLPQVRKAVAAGATIYVVEGEKDVLTLEAAGATATCNPGGAGKWRQEYTESLRGAAKVVAVADKDVPGRRHARKIAASLRAAGVAVEVVAAAAGKDAADHIAAGHGLDDFVPVDLDEAPEEDDGGDGDDAGDGHSGNKSVATQLVRLAEEAGVELFRDGHDTAFVTLPVGSHCETRPLRAKHFRVWLARRYFRDAGKVAGAQALADALNTLEGRAVFDGAQLHVAVRWAEHDGATYLDLGRPAWEVVRIQPDGWSVVTEPPVRFWRPAGFAPLPVPARGGSWDQLFGLLNVRAEDRVLLQACLTAAARPRGPYVILVVQGPQGSAKTTLARVFIRLVDPNEVPIRTFPRDERDLLIAAQRRALLAFDNLSRLPEALADALCRLSTGGGISTRQLYTDAEEIVFGAMRPVVLTSIADLATRPDVLDRAILLNLDALPERHRRPEDEYWREFEQVWPQVLGVVLDSVATAMRRRSSVHLETCPRMADFACWAVAAEPAFGVPEGAFLTAYHDNRAYGHELGLEASVLAPVVRKFAGRHGLWTGTATELLGGLEELVEKAVTQRKAWPKTPSHLSTELRRIEPSLSAVGVDLEFGRRGKKRWIRIEARNAVTGVTRVTVPLQDGLAGDGGGDAAAAAPSLAPSPGKPHGQRGDDGGDADDASSQDSSYRERVA